MRLVVRLMERLLDYRTIMHDESKENRMSCTVNVLVSEPPAPGPPGPGDRRPLASRAGRGCVPTVAPSRENARSGLSSLSPGRLKPRKLHLLVGNSAVWPPPLGRLATSRPVSGSDPGGRPRFLSSRPLHGGSDWDSETQHLPPPCSAGVS